MSNLLLRVLFAVVAIPIVLVAVFKGSWYFWSFALLVSELAWWEFCGMLKFRGFYTRAAMAGYIWIAVLFLRKLSLTPSWALSEGLIFALLIVVCVSELLLKETGFSVSRMAVQFFGAVYIGISGYAIYLASNLSLPGWKLFIPLLVSVWACDTLAYFGGRFFGKTLLAPAISPKKTVEGAIGGMLGAVLGFLTVRIWDGLNWPHAVALGIGIGILSQVGDLAESMIKRWSGVKDSSRLLPGHGGVLDRIDSLLFSAPFVVFYFGIAI